MPNCHVPKSWIANYNWLPLSHFCVVSLVRENWRGWDKIKKHKIQALPEFIKRWYKMKTNKFCWEIFHEHFLWPFTRGNNKMPPWNSKRKLFVFTLSYFGEIIFRNLHVVCNMCWVYFRFIGLAKKLYGRIDRKSYYTM